MARILVAEDEFLVRYMVGEDLTEDGHLVLLAGNGDEAAGMLDGDGDIDLLITDIRMPGAIDGWRLGEIAAGAIPGIRVIYATGYTEETRPLQPHERLLYKPFVFSQVRAAMTELGIRDAGAGSPSQATSA